MKKLIIFLLLANILFANSQSNDANTVSITVYNSNLGVVKETRAIQIPKGISEIKITDVASQIDPTSVFVKLNGDVLEQNYRYDLVSIYSILDRYIDKEINLISEKNNIAGILLQSAGNNIILKQKDNSLLMFNDMSKYQISTPSLPDGLITRPTLVWKVETQKESKQNVELSYQTQGMNWHTEYVAVLNEKDDRMDLNAWVSIENNSGASYKDANLKLIAGDVNRLNKFDYAAKNTELEDGYVRTMVSKRKFEESPLFEYHIYNLQNPTTLANKEIKQISLFSSNNIKIKKIYKLENLYNSNSENLQIGTFIELINSKENNLGLPMPAGKFRFNKKSIESLEFIGENMIKHTPKDDKLSLKLGEAFDITASSRETASEKISDKIVESEFEVIIRNRKNEELDVEVEREIGSFSKLLSSNIKSESVNSSTIKFIVHCKKDGETKLTYKVRFNY